MAQRFSISFLRMKDELGGKVNDFIYICNR